MRQDMFLARPVSGDPGPEQPAPFDFETARARIGESRERGDLQELAFHCGQILIMAQKQGRRPDPDALDLLARLLLIDPEGLDIGPIMLLLRAYPRLRRVIEFDMHRLLQDDEPQIRQILIAGLDSRVNRFGFLMVKDGVIDRFIDFTKSPYPVNADARQRIHTVWIEATSHCNQKCTFCPDPKRESPRELMDLERFKKRARELHDNFDIGYWQLNAYGEPLLHPKLGEMISFIKTELRSPAPVFFTTHGLTLTDKRIDRLLTTLPDEVMISLHNDSAESYALSRSEKIGNYQLLTDRVFRFCSSLMAGSHCCSVRLSVLVNNSNASSCVGKDILSAFADNPERFYRLCLYWQERVRDWAGHDGVCIRLPRLDRDAVATTFHEANHGPEHAVVIAEWDTPAGPRIIFASPRPVGTYANLIPFQRDAGSVQRFEASPLGCGFTRAPSLTIFANGRLGICCLDLETTASFGHADDNETLLGSLTSQAISTMFADLAFGVPGSPGCSVCLGRVRDQAV